MARLTVAAVAGVAVGFFSGNPALGAQAFAATYGATGFLDPNLKARGPRLDDLKAPRASYGVPVPLVFGAWRTAGTIIYASAKREIATTEEVGGKGGPGTDSTTYTYEIDVLYLLSANQIAGVRRIWSYGKLIWSQADDSDEASLAASLNTEHWSDIRVYTGASDQLPDPTYEAAKGVGNAPAYRGRGTVFIEGLQLSGNGQIPLLTFEIATGPGDASGYLLGNIEDADWYPRSSAIHADGSGVTMHVRMTDALGTQTTQVAVQRLAADGTVTTLSTYATEIADYAVGVGVSDESIGVWQLPFSVVTGSGVEVHADSGDFELRSDAGFSVLRYCMRDGDFYYARTTSDATKNFLFKTAQGALLATSAQLPDYVQSIACTGGHVCVFFRGGTEINRYSAADLSFVDTIALPFASSVGTVSVVLLSESDDVLHLLTIGEHYRYEGSWDTVATGIGSAGSTSQDGGIVLTAHALVSDSIYTARLQGSIDPAGAQVYRLGETFAADPVALDEVVSRLCLRTGLLTADDIDVTDLEGLTMRGMALSQVASTRTALETLMSAYSFEAVECDKLRFVRRGKAPVLTIPFEDMGVSEGEPVEPFPIRRLNDIEQPARVTVKYANVLADLQTAAVHSLRQVTQSTAETVYELALALTPTEAKRIADIATMDIAVGLLSVGPVSVSKAYEALEPTDVVLLTNEDGSTYRARILKITDGSGIRTLELVLDEASAVSSVAETDSNYTSSTIVRALAQTDLELLDIPLLRDVDDTPGIYAAAGAVSGSKWPGCRLYSSGDAITYTKVVDFTDRATLGTTTTVLGDWTGGYVFDERNSVTVSVNGDLSSYTRANVLNSMTPYYLIGNEIIFARNATLVSAGVYTLTGLLRGRRGTEPHIGTHEVGERVVVLRLQGLRNVEHQIFELGLARTYKAVTFGRSLASAVAETLTNMGQRLKPFSPVDLRVSRDTSNNATLTWRRRTRRSTRFVGSSNGSVVPLGEASEAYSIDIYSDDTYTTVVRTITAASPTADYSAADQATDGLTPGAEIHARVYQLSARVGRGTPLESAA